MDVSVFSLFFRNKAGWNNYQGDDTGPGTSTEEIAGVVTFSDVNWVVCSSVCPHHCGRKMIRLDATA